MLIDEVQKAVESFAPAALAQSWDNTGILIRSLEPSEESSVNGRSSAKETSPRSGKILLTIDLTPEVVNELIEKGIKCAIAYHPVLFQPINKIDDVRYVRCIRNDISVYSPHTQLDGLMNSHLKELIMGHGSVSASGMNGASNMSANRVTVTSVVNFLREKHGLKTIRVFCSDPHEEYEAGDVEVGVGAAFRNFEGKNKLLITGEMSHHDILKCKRNSTAGILLEHCNSERMFLPELKRRLEETDELRDCEILISEMDSSPLSYE